jgi:hypothetical protein
MQPSRPYYANQQNLVVLACDDIHRRVCAFLFACFVCLLCCLVVWLASFVVCFLACLLAFLDCFLACLLAFVHAFVPCLLVACFRSCLLAFMHAVVPCLFVCVLSCMIACFFGLLSCRFACCRACMQRLARAARVHLGNELSQEQLNSGPALHVLPNYCMLCRTTASS